jgi:hypothetical protein
MTLQFPGENTPCGEGVPLGRGAAPKPDTAFLQAYRIQQFATATQPNGAMRRSDKPSRHSAISIMINLLSHRDS